MNFKQQEITIDEIALPMRDFTNLPLTRKTCTHLSQNEQNELLEVLWEFEDLFDGTLGDWNTEPVNFELKSGAKPYHSRAFPIPKVHSETIKKEVKRLVELGVCSSQCLSII